MQRHGNSKYIIYMHHHSHDDHWKDACSLHPHLELTVMGLEIDAHWMDRSHKIKEPISHLSRRFAHPTPLTFKSEFYIILGWSKFSGSFDRSLTIIPLVGITLNLVHMPHKLESRQRTFKWGREDNPYFKSNETMSMFFVYERTSFSRESLSAE